jgi:hypothetical protein
MFNTGMFDKKSMEVVLQDVWEVALGRLSDEAGNCTKKCDAEHKAWEQG